MNEVLLGTETSLVMTAHGCLMQQQPILSPFKR